MFALPKKGERLVQAQKKNEAVRVYVSVAVDFDSTGQMIPKSLTWEDGHQYGIDRLIDVRPSVAARAGGHGDRYTVCIGNQEKYLFFEHNPVNGQRITGRWFVEKKKP